MGQVKILQLENRRFLTLMLSDQDIAKQKARDIARRAREVIVPATRHEQCFAARLLKCPVCGEPPHYLKIACNTQSGYSYKLNCALHPETRALELGDWFDNPAKAGRSWNERVRLEKIDPFAFGVYCELRSNSGKLTRQQVRTLKGQIFAGDAEGALKGLKKLVGEELERRLGHARETT